MKKKMKKKPEGSVNSLNPLCENKTKQNEIIESTQLKNTNEKSYATSPLTSY